MKPFAAFLKHALAVGAALAAAAGAAGAQDPRVVPVRELLSHEAAGVLRAPEDLWPVSMNDEGDSHGMTVELTMLTFAG